MQTDHNANGGRDARLSRREFFQFAEGSTAAALLAAATAAAGEDHTQLPLTDAQLGEAIEACIEQIKTLLALLRADCPKVASHRIVNAAGSAIVIIAERNVFDGEGAYEVAVNGQAVTYWISSWWDEQKQQQQLWGARIWDGRRIAPRDLIAPAAILGKKLEGDAT
ncbi:MULTISPECIES: hypothetical protein [unclassified Rhizobium]|uniref:hypothetical protein n=1 Tax=unclassified Rhizobium TaxID=2613769 RepID=UPI0007EA2A62|nr:MULTISPECIES: hypothetical protein [unclassified Rhizobium]ANK84462.1 hypothetical protein AMK02_CH00825 [Rhizobium sp. N731]ANL14710.1 hypothetical protein AMJ97_CH00825 [Rhizobium sp. N1314]